MDIDVGRVRSFRLRAHHLDARLPADGMVAAAGVCGLQNTPPGAWETALYSRVDGCTPETLHNALYEEKSLLQVWSYRGVPLVFPAAESDVFLTPLIAQSGEWPWVYTLGITGALDHLQMPFDDLLARTMRATRYLDKHTVKSKEVLDQTLADIIRRDLPKEKQALWGDPSMYVSPDRQTVGGAAVSFLLRPCSFYSLVVFGQRQGGSPTFTSFQNWTGHAPRPVPDADKALVRKFLHAYGPSTVDHFMNWLGCSKRQARRLWDTVAQEMEPVRVAGKACQMLAADREVLQAAEKAEDRLVLLGPHDPYLDLRDRFVILEDKSHQKSVWQYVSNPGAILKGGRVIGTWKGKIHKGKMSITMELWEKMGPHERRELEQLAEEYAAFRRLSLAGPTGLS